MSSNAHSLSPPTPVIEPVQAMPSDPPDTAGAAVSDASSAKKAGSTPIPAAVLPECYYTNHSVRLSHDERTKGNSSPHFCTPASSFGELVRCRLCSVNYLHRACHDTSLRDLSEVAVNAM